MPAKKESGGKNPPADKSWHNIGLALVLAVALVFVCSSYELFSQDSYRITSVEHANSTGTGWYTEAYAVGFEKVNLPYTEGDGYFRLHIRSPQNAITLYITADDCVEEAYFDGISHYQNLECSDETHTETPLKLALQLGEANPGADHILALKVKNLGGPAQLKMEKTDGVFWMSMLMSSLAVLAVSAFLVLAKRKAGAGEGGLRESVCSHLGLITVAFLVLVLSISLLHILTSPIDLNITGIQYAKTTDDQDWYKRGFNDSSFRQITLPFHDDDGFFRIYFDTRQENVQFKLFADDCAEKIFLDEEQVYDNPDCTTELNYENPVDILKNLDTEETHLLAIKTKNVGGPTQVRLTSGSDTLPWCFALTGAVILLLLLAYHKARGNSLNRALQNREAKYFALLALLLVFAAYVDYPTLILSGVHEDQQSNYFHSKTLADGTNPYSLNENINVSSIQMAPAYGALYYVYGALLIKSGYTDVWEWSFANRIPSLICDLATGIVIFLIARRENELNIGIFGTTLFLFNKWSLRVLQEGNLDLIVFFFVMAAIYYLKGRPLLACVLIGVTLQIKPITVWAIPIFIILAGQQAGYRKALAYCFTIPALISIPILITSPTGAINTLLLNVLTHGNQGGVPITDGGFSTFFGSQGITSRIPLAIMFLSLYLLTYQKKIGTYLPIFLSFFIYLSFSSWLQLRYLSWMTPFVPLLLIEISQEYGRIKQNPRN